MKKTITKYLHEGKLVAELDVELLYTEDGWSPYLSLEDAEKMDTVRQALRDGKLSLASSYAKIYRIEPVAV